ncbi:hypothetical protein [Streptococcus gallolyticus]|uniref:hypothetical protein n=1 Tax=Streptococcus gallolyticus TaxID=315405 RepID=UPI002284C792|nr:hypothetical protein [Streptococcus gallolyticus]MCY7152167.1 hypothetical protein [Streptococcus gallolyticus subsp. gallolyticus]MCY7166415.1 hypothetical protein [Streptococcus gallolyticus subsp. gallolyticus]MCY7183746.1 hypothetical protein [Streptococcus gallolyticus subsp. gallolyticus]
MLKIIDEVKVISKNVTAKQSDISQKHSVLRKEVQHDILQGKKSLSGKSDNFHQRYNRYFQSSK